MHGKGSAFRFSGEEGGGPIELDVRGLAAARYTKTSKPDSAHVRFNMKVSGMEMSLWLSVPEAQEALDKLSRAIADAKGPVREVWEEVERAKPEGES